MITWIIYILVAFILFYILYLAIQGVNIGVEAKKFNKTKKKKKNKQIQKMIFQKK